MYPAGSLIIFTTLSGFGLGLTAFLGLGAVQPGGGAVFVGTALAFLLTGSGLVASLFHLGHPERAWRALTQWRSSWLSREGVLSILTLAVLGLYSAARIFLGLDPWPLGWLAALLAVLSVYATAMIYGSLRSVPAWSDPLTPVVYLGFTAAGGALLTAFLARLFGQAAAFWEVLAFVLLLAAWAIKLLWWSRAPKRGFGGSTPETATGLGEIGRVRLFEAPHTSPNYLMKEMIFVVGRRHARKLRLIAAVLGAALPLVAVALSLALGGAWPLLLVGIASNAAGMLAERWLFFAEARHTVALYYGHGEAGASPNATGVNRGAITQAGG